MNEAFKKLAEEFRDATPTTEWDIATLKLMPADREALPTDIVDGYLGTVSGLPGCPECELFFMDAGREQDSSIEIFKELAGKAGGRLPKADDDIYLSGPTRIMRWCLELFRTFGRTEWKHEKSWLKGKAFERSAELCEWLAGEEKTPKAKKSTRKPNINAQMLDIIQKDELARGWTVTQWRKKLKCAGATIVGTKTWQDLSLMREKLKAQKAKDRRRKTKPKDQD